eukprot:SAG22_NODE_65_length_23128_cov_51.766609_8_plen_106_part_00
MAELAEFRKEQEAEFATFQEKMKKRLEEKAARGKAGVELASRPWQAVALVRGEGGGGPTPSTCRNRCVCTRRAPMCTWEGLWTSVAPSIAGRTAVRACVVCVWIT